jgi:hypothetical protein
VLFERRDRTTLVGMVQLDRLWGQRATDRRETKNSQREGG